MASSTKIDTVRDFTDKGLRELESWLEPWIKGQMKGETGTGGAGTISFPNVMVYSVAGALSIQTGVLRWYPQGTGELTRVHCALATPSTGIGGVTVRLIKNGNVNLGSVMVASGSSVNQFAPSPGEFVLGDFFTIDITSIGATTPGGGLVVQLYGTFSG